MIDILQINILILLITIEHTLDVEPANKGGGGAEDALLKYFKKLITTQLLNALCRIFIEKHYKGITILNQTQFSQNSIVKEHSISTK